MIIVIFLSFCFFSFSPSAQSQQIRMSVISMPYLNTTCPHSHHHSHFIETGAIGTPMCYEKLI